MGRWGQKFEEFRNWRKYNEQLVARGEFLLDLGWVKNWGRELERMNREKRGRPFLFPESLIKLQAVWHQWIDYRAIEGVTRQLVACAKLPKYNDFSTINRRVNKLDLTFELPKTGRVFVACDGSGIKMCNSGEYMEEKHGRKKKKKFIRVTISADPFTKKILGCDVCVDGEGKSEPKVAIDHIRKLSEQGLEVVKFWGDGAFDARDLFDCLKKFGIESAIKIRKNARAKSRGSPRRKIEVVEYKKKGYEQWAQEKQYGLRWGAEGVFSAVKRKFGEKTRARALANKLLEARRKFWVYERMRQYAAAV